MTAIILASGGGGGGCRGLTVRDPSATGVSRHDARKFFPFEGDTRGRRWSTNDRTKNCRKRYIKVTGGCGSIRYRAGRSRRRRPYRSPPTSITLFIPTSRYEFYYSFVSFCCCYSGWPVFLLRRRPVLGSRVGARSSLGSRSSVVVSMEPGTSRNNNKPFEFVPCGFVTIIRKKLVPVKRIPSWNYFQCTIRILLLLLACYQGLVSVSLGALSTLTSNNVNTDFSKLLPNMKFFINQFWY